MERFRNIDWTPALEDIIDDVFIRDERMERESAMYRIMRDEFTDPFQDMEQDYANVNMELIKKYLAEDPLTDIEEEKEKEKTDGKKKKSLKKNVDTDCKQEKRPYVPGIRKLPFYFPKRSCLAKDQQSMCLRAVLNLFSSEEKKLNQEERLELQSYIALKDKIFKEQEEFLTFAESKWDDSFEWPIKYNRFIIYKWRTKMKKFQELPRYYIESKNILLSMQKINSTFIKSIELKFISCLHQLGSFSKVTWPKFDRPSMLNINPAILFNKYQCVTPDKVTQHFRLPVSEDTCCENLAMDNKADFVISSSGLKCLLNTDSYYLNSWIVPVVIKSHNGKNVVYIDKRIPPSIATIPQKNNWVYKYILRHCLIDNNNETLKKKMQHTKKKSAAHSDSDNIDLECSAEFNDYLKIYEEDFYSSDEENSENLNDLANVETNDIKTNVMYKLFTIGPTESLNHELGKHDVKEYQMLVRTKTDGKEEFPTKKSQYVILAPKMEHQLGFGAEAVTFEELSQQWASLMFRPETTLARVRIAADTSEMIQIEKHTTKTLTNEMRRLYNVKTEDSLSILHNIIEGLSSLTPGRYIMRHVPQRGPFAYVYKQVEEPGKNVFDLHMICQSAMFETVPKLLWPRIDTMVTTPAIRQFKKMPAMFNAYQTYSQSKEKKKRGRPKNIGNSFPALRRNLRLKEVNEKKKMQ